MSFAKWSFLIAATALLAGCFMSVMPLFAPEDAEQPILDGAKFAVFPLDENGKRKESEPIIITASRKTHSYVFTPDNDKPFRAMFDDIGNGYFVGVALNMRATKSPIYGLFHQVGESWFAYAPVCSDFKKLTKAHHQTLAHFHIVETDNECRFKTYSDLKNALMFVAAYTLPKTEYVPQGE
jgi:hypothetical protein